MLGKPKTLWRAEAQWGSRPGCGFPAFPNHCSSYCRELFLLSVLAWDFVSFFPLVPHLALQNIIYFTNGIKTKTALRWCYRNPCCLTHWSYPRWWLRFRNIEQDTWTFGGFWYFLSCMAVEDQLLEKLWPPLNSVKRIKTNKQNSQVGKSLY